MLKYFNTQIVFQEIPDEISLAINITQCPNKCKGCHSPYLQEDIGQNLTKDELITLIKENPGITCVLFMGGDLDRTYLNSLAFFIKNNYDLKVGYYSGLSHILNIDKNSFDYIKLGPYIKALGPLNKSTTNQKLYKVINNNLINITNKIYKHENKS